MASPSIFLLSLAILFKSYHAKLLVITTLLFYRLEAKVLKPITGIITKKIVSHFRNQTSMCGINVYYIKVFCQTCSENATSQGGDSPNSDISADRIFP